MFPKKIIGKYLGNEESGITIGKIKFLPGTYVECNVNEEVFIEILELSKQGVFYLFEFASVKAIDDKANEVIQNVNNSLKEVVNTKYDGVSYKDNNLNFYANNVMVKTVELPLPEKPREIELSVDSTHILWRVKPIGKELIKWEQLIPLSDLAEEFDDTYIIQELEELEERISALEALK